MKRAYIEITNVCNLSCSFCPKHQRKLEYMDVDFFEQVVKQVKKVADQVYLHVMGEPLLHPQLEEILKICDRVAIPINLTTNGTLLKEKITILENSKLLRKVVISIQSYEGNGGKDYLAYLQSVVEAVRQLPSSVIVEYRLWNWGQSKLAGEEVEYLTHAYGVQGDIPSILSSNKYDHSIKLGERTYIMFDTPFAWPVQGREEKLQGYCPALQKQVAILVSGDVVPCCLDSEGKMKLGNLHHQSLEEILKSERARALVAGFQERKRKEELCQHCSFIDLF